MFYLIAIALLSLFTAFKLKLGGVGQLRPFDGIVILMIMFMLFSARVRLPKQMPVGLLALMPFFVWHVVSAATVSFENGIREAVQTSILAIFALILTMHGPRIDYAKLARVLLIGMLLITAYNIYWHIDQGFWSGWKRLNDPKRIFSFLPLVAGCLLIFANKANRGKYWALWLFIGVIIVISGERKSLLIYLILWAALITRGRMLAATPLVAAGLFALTLIGSVTENTYLARQLGTILNPEGTILPIEAIASGQIPESMSNAQRLFALQLSGRLFLENPLFGVGTNGYVNIVRAEFAHLPEYLQLAPHGEFLRILTENGLVGLTLYLSIWVLAVVRLSRNLQRLVRASVLRPRQASVLRIVLLVPAVIYVGLEASGTHSMVVLIIVSLLPSFCEWVPQAQARRHGGRHGPLHLREATVQSKRSPNSHRA